MSGETRAAVAYGWKPEGTQMRLRLEPYGSTIVYFGASTRPALLEPTSLQDLRVVNGSLLARADRPGRYVVSSDQGRSEQHVETLPRPAAARGPWRFATDEARPTQMSDGRPQVMDRVSRHTVLRGPRAFTGRS